MKTILVIASHPELADTIRGLLNAEQYRIIHRRDVTGAEPLLGQGLLDVCILGAELNDVQSLWAVEKIRRRLPHCPMLVYTGVTPWEWEEEAYLHVVAHVLSLPPRARALNTLLERLVVPASAPAALPARRPAARPLEAPAVRLPSGPHNPVRALEVLRDFSAILTHSLCAEAMLKQFLLLLREIIGVNRAVIFLRPPPAAFGGEILRRPAFSFGLRHWIVVRAAGTFRAVPGGRHRRLSFSPWPDSAPGRRGRAGRH